MTAPDAEVPRYRSIADVPYLQARARGSKVALVHGETTLGYDALDDRSRRFAAWLVARGLEAGSRVALLLPNVPEFAVAYFGAMAAGAVAVPVNYRLTPAEVGYIISDCAAAVLVTTRAQFEQLRPLPQTRSVAAWLLV